jgi:hypothetical protein
MKSLFLFFVLLLSLTSLSNSFIITSLQQTKSVVPRSIKTSSTTEVSVGSSNANKDNEFKKSTVNTNRKKFIHQVIIASSSLFLPIPSIIHNNDNNIMVAKAFDGGVGGKN